MEIGGETKKLTAAIKSLNSDAKKLQSELKGVNTLLKFDPKNVTLLKQKQDLLVKSIEQTSEKLSKLKAAQEDADRAMADGQEVNQVEYRNLQREIANTEQRLGNLVKQQREFASIAAVQLQAVAKEFKGLGDRISKVGESLVPLTVAIAAVGAASVAASVKFESSFAGVKKTVNATTEQLEALAEASRDAALSKPVDVNDINYIMELGGQLGIAVDQLGKFADVIGDLSVSTNLGVEDAAMQLAQMMNIMGTAQSDIDRLGATIVALGNTSATTEATIADFAMRIAGSGNAIGLTESQVLGLSASLASVGIQAEMGGSAISTIMSKVDKDVAMNGENLTAWAETAGMSASQFAEAWETDAASALIALIGGMEEASLSGENLNLILDDLGISNIRQTDTLKRLSSAATLMARTMDTANVAWEENSALTKEATQRYETTESKLVMLKNQVIDIAISVGNGLKSALVGAMDAIAPVLDTVSSMAKSFEEADPQVQAFVISIGALVASAAPLLIITGKLVTGIGSMMEACAKSAAALAAKAAATSADTTATTANTAAVNISIIRQAVKEAADARAVIRAQTKAAATTADTAATAANTAATTANATATGAITLKTAAFLIATKAKAAATTAATVAQIAWNAAMTANPIGVVVMAVATLVTAIGALTLAISTTISKQGELTEASREQEKQLNDLQATYDKALATQGEHSDAAIKAKHALDQEKAAFEASRETLDEFNERAADTIQTHDELMESMNETAVQADVEAGKILYLADRISALAKTEGKSAEDKSTLAAITAELNAAVADLNLTYDEQNDKLSLSAEAIANIARAEADRLRSEAAMQSYSDLLSEQVELEMQLAEAEQNLAAETERNVQSWGAFGDVQVWTSQAQLDLEQTVADTNAALEENAAAQQQALEISAEYTAKQTALSLAVEEVAAGTLSAEEAAEKYGKTVKSGLTADEVRAEHALAVAEATAELEEQLSSTAAEIEGYAIANDSFRKAMELSGISVEEFSDMLVASDAKFEDVIEDIEEYSARSASAFSQIADSSANTLETLKATLAYNLEATENWSANLEAVFGRTGVSFSEEFVNAVRDGGVEEFGTVMAELAQVSDEELQKISDSFATNGQAGVEAYLAEQQLLVAGTRTALEQADITVSDELSKTSISASEAGTKTGTAYTDALSQAIATAPEEVQTYIEELEGALDEAQQIASITGAKTGAAYTETLSEAIALSPTEVQAYIAEIETQLASLTSEVTSLAADTSSAYGESTAQALSEQTEAATQAAATLNQSIIDEFSKLLETSESTGRKMTISLAKGITAALNALNSAISKITASVEKELKQTQAKANRYGSGTVMAYANGISAGKNAVNIATRNLVASMTALSTFGDDAYKWGYDAGFQFARGLNSTKSLIKKAATNIAEAAYAILHFSVPDEGPLADADEYGPDFGQLIADGLLSTVDDVRNAAQTIAENARQAMTETFSTPTEIKLNLFAEEEGLDETLNQARESSPASDKRSRAEQASEQSRSQLSQTLPSSLGKTGKDAGKATLQTQTDAATQEMASAIIRGLDARQVTEDTTWQNTLQSMHSILSKAFDSSKSIGTRWQNTFQSFASLLYKTLNTSKKTDINAQPEVLTELATQPLSFLGQATRRVSELVTDLANAETFLLGFGADLKQRQVLQADIAKRASFRTAYLTVGEPNLLDIQSLSSNIKNPISQSEAASTTNNYYIDGINVTGTTDGQFAAEFMALMQRYGRLAKT